MSKKISISLLSLLFLGFNLNLNALAADEDRVADIEEQIEEVGQTQKSRPVMQAIASSNDDTAMQSKVVFERIMERIDNLHQLNELLEKYNSDVMMVKNDPTFNEIKPALKEAYEMISSIPFMLSIASGSFDMFKVEVEESMAKKASINGFQALNEDVQDFMDHTFSYGDKFIEFLRKFSQHFTENKMVKELLAD